MNPTKTTTISLDQVRIASPCSMKWDDLAPVGEGATVRHCGQCRLNVYNLSGMTREEAELVVGKAEGRLCVGYFLRADGTMLTRDCPVGLRAARATVVRTVGRLAAAAGLVLTGAALAGTKARGDIRVGDLEPLRDDPGVADADTTNTAADAADVLGGNVTAAGELHRGNLNQI